MRERGTAKEKVDHELQEVLEGGGGRHTSMLESAA